MLKQILGDIQAFFAMAHVTPTSSPVEYARLVRIINRSYAFLATEYPLPETDSTTYISNVDTSRYFGDYLPFVTKDRRTLADVPLILLTEFSIADIFGLHSTKETSSLVLNNCKVETIQRKQYLTENACSFQKTLIDQPVAGFSNYTIYMEDQYISTWQTEVIIDDKLYRRFSETTQSVSQFTSSEYGTISIDHNLGRVTINSASKAYQLRITHSCFGMGRYRAVSDSTGIRFLGNPSLHQPSRRVVYSQACKPPMLLSPKDKSVNPEYDNAATIYAIENLAVYSRDMCNPAVMQIVNDKKLEQIDRLTRLVSSYRTKKPMTGLDMQIIGGSYGIGF